MDKQKGAATEQAVVRSIKGFDQDLRCRGFQYAIGETYQHDGDVAACSSGFHACDAEQHPLEVFGFYAPAGSRFCEVTQGGTLSRQVGCSKIASATITIGVEITVGDLVKRAWDYVWSRAIKAEDSHVVVDQGAASATGWQGAAMTSGFEGCVMGSDGNALFAVERERWNGPIVSAACGIVGQHGVQPDRWYTCRAGELVEVA